MILRRESLLILFLIIFLVYPIFVKGEYIIDVPFIAQYPPGTDWYHTKNCGPTSYLMIDSFYTSRLLIVDTIKSMDDWLFDKYGFPVNNYNGSLTDTKDIFNIALNFGDFYEEDVVKTRSLKDIKDAVNKVFNEKFNSRVNDMINEIVARVNKVLATNNVTVKNTSLNSKEDARNRLKLVLMHDRSRLDPGTLLKMRDELVDVISRYVEIDREALDLNLENETNTIALVANIPLLRSKE